MTPKSSSNLPMEHHRGYLDISLPLSHVIISLQLLSFLFPKFLISQPLSKTDAPDFKPSLLPNF